MANLQNIADRKERLLDNLITNHEKRIQRALDQLEREVVKSYNRFQVGLGGEQVKAKLLVELRKDLRKNFESTFLKVAKQNVSDYKDSAFFFENTYSNITKDLPPRWKSLIKVDNQIVNDLTKISFQGFEDIAETFINDISSGVYENALVGRGKKDIVNELRGKINGVYKQSNQDEIKDLVKTAKENRGTALGDRAVEKLHTIYSADRLGNNLSRYSRQMTHDSLMQFDAMYTKQKGDSLGLKHYLYYGDLITDSRSHCQTYAGKVLSNEQIEIAWSGSWSGKSSGDPHIVRGGYNCRHFFQPIDPEWTDLNFGEVEKTFETEGVNPFGDDWKNLNDNDLKNLMTGFGVQNGINKVFSNMKHSDSKSLKILHKDRRIAHYSSANTHIEMMHKDTWLGGWKDTNQHGKWLSVLRHETGHFIDNHFILGGDLNLKNLKGVIFVKKIKKLDEKKLSGIGIDKAESIKQQKIVRHRDVSYHKRITGKPKEDARNYAFNVSGDYMSLYAVESTQADLVYLIDWKDRFEDWHKFRKAFISKYLNTKTTSQMKTKLIDDLWVKSGLGKHKKDWQKLFKKYKVDPTDEVELLIGMIHGNPNSPNAILKYFEASGKWRNNVHYGDFIGSMSRNTRFRNNIEGGWVRIGDGHKVDYYTGNIVTKAQLDNPKLLNWKYDAKVTNAGMHEMYANYIDLLYDSDQAIAQMHRVMLEKFAPNVIKDFDDITQVLM